MNKTILLAGAVGALALTGAAIAQTTATGPHGSDATTSSSSAGGNARAGERG